MKIIINLSGIKPERKKEVINSIIGVVKAMAKRVGFSMTFEVGE